ncbi:ABC transporter substrate-binding protein [Aquamicrobium sp. LC103]|uniref:ABC transporter substrate-binding protein n=1 Tax=Aquamicrobium sp. LC103 TaxID=1120658 RepID=UPI00063EB31F|nr:ABC transporter substrate-binding protein [Aquamicrobium sp. LC103]TKT74390.1 ABC transporter substrate-binding protein [Aquamicrobium sp. LC103]
MVNITRRAALGLAAGAAGSLALPRFAIGQSDNRASVTIAVQKISNTNTLDCIREQSNVGERSLYPNLWEGLIGRNWLGDQGPVPLLATEWKRVDDRTVELKLRDGVKFHNGDPLTVEDVAFTFGQERMFADSQPTEGKTIYVAGLETRGREAKELPVEIPANARRQWPALLGVEIVDRNTVRFVNGTPDVTIEGRLFQAGAQIMNRRAWEEAKSYDDWARRPITTGPYMVSDYKPDQSLLLVSYDEYWGGLPPLKQIRFVEVPEVASRINGLLSGEYDFACDIPPDQIVGVESNSDFEVLGGTILNHRITVFDKHHPQLENPLVRRAMTHAIDRQAIVDSLWAGRTAIPNGLQWPFYGDMFFDDWKVPEYNPELARQLLQEAGYKGDPIPYRVLNNYYTNQTATAQIQVEMWKQVGLNVEIEMKENWSQVLEHTPNRAVRDWSNSATFSDPVSSIVAQHGPNGQQQQVREWTNEEVNRMSVVLETSTDRAKRREAFRRMLEICEREDPAYTVLHQNAVFTAKPKALKWKAASAFAMDFRPGNWS